MNSPITGHTGVASPQQLTTVVPNKSLSSGSLSNRQIKGLESTSPRLIVSAEFNGGTTGSLADRKVTSAFGGADVAMLGVGTKSSEVGEKLIDSRSAVREAVSVFHKAIKNAATNFKGAINQAIKSLQSIDGKVDLAELNNAVKKASSKLHSAVNKAVSLFHSVIDKASNILSGAGSVIGDAVKKFSKAVTAAINKYIGAMVKTLPTFHAAIDKISTALESAINKAAATLNSDIRNTTNKYSDDNNSNISYASLGEYYDIFPEELSGNRSFAAHIEFLNENPDNTHTIFSDDESIEGSYVVSPASFKDSIEDNDHHETLSGSVEGHVDDEVIYDALSESVEDHVDDEEFYDALSEPVLAEQPVSDEEFFRELSKAINDGIEKGSKIPS